MKLLRLGFDRLDEPDRFGAALSNDCGDAALTGGELEICELAIQNSAAPWATLTQSPFVSTTFRACPPCKRPTIRPDVDGLERALSVRELT